MSRYIQYVRTRSAHYLLNFSLSILILYEKIVYTGSDSYSSRLGMDKYRSSILVKSSTNFSIPETKIVRLINLKKELSKLPLPVFIKPNRNGSSICSYVLRDLSGLDSILKNFYAHHTDEDEILIQEYIKDMVEVSCGCLEKKDHAFISLPPIEIVPKVSEFFDYKAKYTKNGSLERIPAIGISKEQRKHTFLIICVSLLIYIFNQKRLKKSTNKKGNSKGTLITSLMFLL